MAYTPWGEFSNFRRPKAKPAGFDANQETETITSDAQLSRRERQIMDVVYTRGEVAASDVVDALPDAPSYTAVRTFLRILEEKGYLTHTKQGRRYVYKSTQPRRRAGQSAIRRVLTTFFDGSMEDALAAYMADPQANIDPEEMRRLARLIEQSGKAEDRR